MWLYILVHATPVALGYCIGRWLWLWCRLVPLLVILGYGYMWVEYSVDGYDYVYFPISLLYVLSLIVGLAIRAKVEKVKFWQQVNFDWIVILILLFVFRYMYFAFRV